MASYSEQSDRITLSSLDTRILVALLVGAQNAYEIARQCETDIDGEPVSNGNVYRALVSLKRLLLVSSRDSVSLDARQRTVYRITSTGRLVVWDRITTLKGMIEIADGRLANKK